MAEVLAMVCDVCQQPADTTVRIEINGHRVEKDLCRKHLDALKAGTRALRRGRKPTRKKVPA